MAEQPQARFAFFDEVDDPPRRWPWWLAAGILAVVVAAALTVVATRHSSGQGQPRAAPTPTATQLPPGVHRLPGEYAPPGAEPVGIVGLVRPGRPWISRAAAIRDYRHIYGAASEGGRRILTALVRADYLDGGVRTATMWVVSVWYHPGYTNSQYDWCVDDGFVDGLTGRSRGHRLMCPLPPGYFHPRPVK